MTPTHFVHTGTTDELPDLITREETTLSLAKTYFNGNGLMINPNKTQCLFVSTRPFIRRIPPDTTSNFDNALITPSKHIKNLDIYMDCHLSFDAHIQEMHKKVMKILFFLHRIKDKLKLTQGKLLSSPLLSTLSTIAYQSMAQLIVPYYGGYRNSGTLQ